MNSTAYQPLVRYAGILQVSSEASSERKANAGRSPRKGNAGRNERSGKRRYSISPVQRAMSARRQHMQNASANAHDVWEGVDGHKAVEVVKGFERAGKDHEFGTAAWGTQQRSGCDESIAWVRALHGPLAPTSPVLEEHEKRERGDANIDEQERNHRDHVRHAPSDVAKGAAHLAVRARHHQRPQHAGHAKSGLAGGLEHDIDDDVGHRDLRVDVTGGEGRVRLRTGS